MGYGIRCSTLTHVWVAKPAKRSKTEVRNNFPGATGHEHERWVFDTKAEAKFVLEHIKKDSIFWLMDATIEETP